MPRSDVTAQFAKMMDKLLTERKKHLATIAKHSTKVAEIEGLFGQFGVSLESPKPATKVGRSAQKMKKAKGRRRRGVFSETADQFVLGLLKGKALTTAELTAVWSQSGRGGRVDNSLTKLTKSRQVKRNKIKGGAGSQYSLA